MKWFQFSLGRLFAVMLFLSVGCGFAVPAFAGTLIETKSQIMLRFACSILAAAAFGAAAGTVMRNAYNGFAIGVFVALLLYLLAFCGFVIKLHHP